MNNLNSIVIEGSLLGNPSFKLTPKGTPVCAFSIESNRYHRDDEDNLLEEVNVFNVESWLKLAEACRDLGHNGRGVRVVGRLKEDHWAGSDGKPYSKVVIVAEHIEFRPYFGSGGDEEEELSDCPSEGIQGDISQNPATSF
jgi:single-strand DNA-binding protein